MATESISRRRLIAGGARTAGDGWQCCIRNGHEVTWKYYPDDGLRAFIEWLDKELVTR